MDHTHAGLLQCRAQQAGVSWPPAPAKPTSLAPPVNISGAPHSSVLTRHFVAVNRAIGWCQRGERQCVGGGTGSDGKTTVSRLNRAEIFSVTRAVRIGTIGWRRAADGSGNQGLQDFRCGAGYVVTGEIHGLRSGVAWIRCDDRHC